MNFFELAAKRESCRSYTDEKVSREDLQKMLQTAQLAPSACNSQPWRAIVVDEENSVEAIRPLLQDKISPINRFVRNVPAFIVICEGTACLSARVGGKVKNNHYASLDIGLYTAHLCFAAAELGLGTCIMGWFNEPEIKKLLDIPEHVRIRLVLAVGRSAKDAPREKARKPLENVTAFGKWSCEE